MSITSIKTVLVGIVLSVASAARVEAQQYQPFIDPGTFNHDLQFFAPADYEEYGGEVIPKTGWYASYDRLYLYVSRPEVPQLINALQSETVLDSTWGNRYQVGYMTEQDHGWNFSVTHVDGPGADNVLRVERVNRWLDTTAAGGGAAATPTAVFPSSDRNDSETDERTIDLSDSLNVGSLSSFELNKVFRLKPLHKGLVLEPMIGFRYTQFTDYTRNDTYDRFDDTGVLVPPVPIFDQTLGITEQYVTNRTSIRNDMVGGQLGLRAFQQLDRWTLSGEVRAFALQNFQNLSFKQRTELVQYGGVGVGNDPEVVVYSQNRAYDNAAEFVFGGEVRGEAAFALTRDISMKFGVNFVDFGRGVARGPDLRSNDQDLLMYGFNLGLQVNR